MLLQRRQCACSGISAVLLKMQRLKTLFVHLSLKLLVLQQQHRRRHLLPPHLHLRPPRPALWLR